MNAHTHSAFRIAYAIGILLCVVWPLVIQCLLGTLIHPVAQLPPDFVLELGYTFTGLSFLAALLVWKRMKELRTSFSEQPPERRPALVLRETLLASVLFELSAVYGLVYYLLGGPHAGRYSRTFALLPIFMFLAFVPRPSAWQKAAEK